MVSGSGVNIQSIVPIAPEGEEASLCFQLQTMTSGGATHMTYIYMNDQDAKDNSGDENATAGWYNEDMDTRVDVTFDSGEAFIIFSDFAEGATVQSAGQVVTGKQTIPLRANANLIGNNRPVELNIQDVTPVAPEGEEASLCFQLQTMTSGGATDKTYIYMNDQDAKDNSGDENAIAGWYNEDMDTRVDVTFSAGAGFILFSDFASDSSVTLPKLSLQ